MKKVDSTALAGLALSALLATGCENFATKDDLAQVHSELAQANLELQEADQNLQQVQSQLAEANMALEELKKPSTTSATHFREVAFDFDNLDPIDPDNKNDPRRKFMGALESMSKNIANTLEELPDNFKVTGFAGKFEQEGVSTPKQVRYVLTNRSEGFVTLAEKRAVEEAIRQRAVDAGIAIPLRLDPGPSELLVLHSAANSYNSVAGTGTAEIKIDPGNPTCTVEITIRLSALAKSGAEGYVAQVGKDGIKWVLSRTTGQKITLEGLPGEVVNDQCRPVRSGNRSKAYVMTVLKDPTVAEYYELDFEPEAQDFKLAPIAGRFTTKMPACPPSNRGWPTEFEGEGFNDKLGACMEI
jgi:hypothetical protein